jgi:type IV pilus assembly protein PilA
MKKKKGFTLVELLAVIVILAVLVLLAVPSVLKMMDGAKNNAFKIEAENIAKAAKSAYADDLLNNDTTRSTANGYCYSISYLKTGGYVDKTFSADHKGSILIGETSTLVWYTDGDRSVTEDTAGEVAVDGTLNGDTTSFNTCPITIEV